MARLIVFTGNIMALVKYHWMERIKWESGQEHGNIIAWMESYPRKKLMLTAIRMVNTIPTIAMAKLKKRSTLKMMREMALIKDMTKTALYVLLFIIKMVPR